MTILQINPIIKISLPPTTITNSNSTTIKPPTNHNKTNIIKDDKPKLSIVSATFNIIGASDVAASLN